MERLATGRELVLKQVVGALRRRDKFTPRLSAPSREGTQQHRQKGDGTEGAVWAAALTRLRLAHIPAALFGIPFPPFFVA